MAKQNRDGNVVTVTGMSLKGGGLPNGFKVFLTVQFNYDDVSPEELMDLASEGSSIRVKAQAKLRKESTSYLRGHGVEAEELTPEVLAELEDKDPVVFYVATDFEAGERTQDPKKAVARSLSKMDEEDRIEFLMDEMGLDRETAEMVSAKHN